MDEFLKLAKELNASVLDSKVCATGGGAFKFEKDFRKVGLLSFLSLPSS